MNKEDPLLTIKYFTIFTSKDSKDIKDILLFGEYLSFVHILAIVKQMTIVFPVILLNK